MKQTILMMAGFIVSLAAGAQKIKESEVPAAIKEHFKKNYVNAKEIKWEKENANFEVEFEIGETEQSIVYDNSGKVMETEIEIKTEELPAAARDYISRNYKDAKIKEATKITDDSGTIKYEAEIKNKDLIFDSTGKFKSEHVESKKDKD